MEQIISIGTTSDGYEYFIAYEGTNTGIGRHFRKNLETGKFEELDGGSYISRTF